MFCLLLLQVMFNVTTVTVSGGSEDKSMVGQRIFFELIIFIFIN